MNEYSLAKVQLYINQRICLLINTQTNRKVNNHIKKHLLFTS